MSNTASTPTTGKESKNKKQGNVYHEDQLGNKMYIRKLFKVIVTEDSDESVRDIRIGEGALTILDAKANDLVERIAHQVAQIIRRSDRQTVNQKDVVTAALWVLPTRLGRQALKRATKADNKYMSSIEKQPVKKARKAIN